MKRLFFLAAVPVILAAQTAPAVKYFCSQDNGQTWLFCSLPPVAPEVKFVDLEVPSWSGDKAGAVWYLTATPNPPASLMLFRNGMLQTQNVDYKISGSIVTFLSASIPEKGAVLRASYRH